MWINNATCKIAYPQVSIGRLALISNDLGTNFRRFPISGAAFTPVFK